jgi:hypothetical protein
MKIHILIHDLGYDGIIIENLYYNFEKAFIESIRLTEIERQRDLQYGLTLGKDYKPYYVESMEVIE